MNSNFYISINNLTARRVTSVLAAWHDDDRDIYISCLAISMDIPDPFSPPLPIFYCFWQVLRVTFCIGTELQYVGPSWSSCLCTSMLKDPQEYISYELIPTSPAVSRMSRLCNFDSFHDWWLVAVQLLLCGVACSILLAALLCSCRQAFSPYVLLASMKSIHVAVSTQPLLERNCISFYPSGLTSIWPIVYQ